MSRFTTGVILLCLAVAVSGGCRIIRPVAPQLEGCFIDDRTDFSTVGRVAVLEFADYSNEPSAGRSITESLVGSLQKRNLFGVTVLWRNEPQWQELGLGRGFGYTAQELADIRRRLGADAIMSGYVSQYQPYPHLLVGLNIRMEDLRSGRLLWAIENIWDSSDKEVERRMKRYYENQLRSGYEPMGWQMLITSPAAFNRFVCYQIAWTVPESAGGKGVKNTLSSENDGEFSGK